MHSRGNRGALAGSEAVEQRHGRKKLQFLRRVYANLLNGTFREKRIQTSRLLGIELSYFVTNMVCQNEAVPWMEKEQTRLVDRQKVDENRRIHQGEFQRFGTITRPGQE
jgi:hypothetical protein